MAKAKKVNDGYSTQAAHELYEDAAMKAAAIREEQRKVYAELQEQKMIACQSRANMGEGSYLEQVRTEQAYHDAHMREFELEAEYHRLSDSYPDVGDDLITAAAIETQENYLKYLRRVLPILQELDAETRRYYAAADACRAAGFKSGPTTEHAAACNLPNRNMDNVKAITGINPHKVCRYTDRVEKAKKCLERAEEDLTKLM